MGIVTDILSRASSLQTDRSKWETVWREIADLCLPDHARFTYSGLSRYDGLSQGPSSVDRGRIRFDDTAVRAIDRLASGMESLVTPQSEKWHGLGVEDPLAPEETDEEAEYFETLRDYFFAVRYNARSGFITAHQKALRSAIGLGTGVVFVEENMSATAHALPALYRYLPLSENLLAVDAQGEPDTNYRCFNMTARQMAQRWPGKISDKVQQAADDNKRQDQMFQVVHAVQPRAELGSSGSTNRNAPFSSFYIDRSNNHLIGESGFYEFPFIIYYWQPVEDQAYAQSPIMLAMADIKGLNGIRKTTLRGLQQYFDPPIAIAGDGVMNRPNLNPRSVNPNAIDSNGRLRIQPIITTQRPDFINEIISAERDGVNQSMYINLFQILAQNPNMTATEAMLRANEKGELLGPAGGKIQQAMAREVERLGGIIGRKGAYNPGSALAPPESLSGRNFGPRFTSPLDRLRRSQEGIGIQQTMEGITPLLQAGKMDVLDNFDTDEIARTLSEINGAPRKILKRVEERDAARAQTAQRQNGMAMLEAAKTGGEAAKNIVPAMAQAQQMAAAGATPAPAPAQ